MKQNKLIKSDCRIFKLIYDGGLLSPYHHEQFTQLEFLRIIKALKNANNNTLADKLMRFVVKIDNKENRDKNEKVETDFERKLPRNTNAILFGRW